MNAPALRHWVEQYLAFCLEVQGPLAAHKHNLIEAGWSEPEAWALCQVIEERLLEPWVAEPEEQDGGNG